MIDWTQLYVGAMAVTILASLGGVVVLAVSHQRQKVRIEP